ncbi:formylglycine-generating enzyme family protein [Nodosilinea sp. FACHB-141]|nr:formylglycine-generating enzyme family protein [Nodosilinea sp. FACHB-141]
MRSFASVTADILNQLGGDYAQFAQALRQGAEPAQPTRIGGFDPSDFPLQDIEYDVAEFINFPSLEPFKFIEAHFEDDTSTFPPPLQPDEFVVITLETQTDPPPPDNLEQFEFTIATLHRDRGQWQIQRQPSSAYRFIEQLTEPSSPSLFRGIAQRLNFQHNADRVGLEMVSIPGGTFAMGSPDSEPDLQANEGPQHEVTVPSFWIGRYPVTQAQWRAVAAMPQVDRELKPDPARFKGENRPVERVTWFDAAEFCARLSAHTGRQYRLPSEAEWEYACRAGTTTPFHFGETISSELANYQGSTAYADGPTREDATKTTSIDHFGVANAFGLSDMHGNVFEWCQDYWHSNYEGAPTDGSAWIEGKDSEQRVCRGGSWFSFPRNCRSASRSNSRPGFVSDYDIIGFRVVCSAPKTLQPPTG